MGRNHKRAGIDLSKFIYAGQPKRESPQEEAPAEDAQEVPAVDTKQLPAPASERWRESNSTHESKSCVRIFPKRGLMRRIGNTSLTPLILIGIPVF